ncbi:hypothetical protein FR991_13710 [Bacteroides fragilis]|uniref:Uncharacterized protein n=2 Tax=Bacteroides fragilis TaxID=817 RepID=Q64XP8_BACFR|nr:hypothetical protein HMPREF0101_00029 [Bacteroides fragilis]BAD47728.1 hypothetical protein BF0978 [Bacteroides fragilis YCH46]KAA4700083.1 hypothetical protein F3B28_11280 [Bacteroides fragilis]KAA4708603.1 hypothetical protein F3B27_10105 [Bacteroides fragilis]KAA4717936.1 hypothetical protein F3B32_13045 [Bacteroides fragilis]
MGKDTPFTTSRKYFFVNNSTPTDERGIIPDKTGPVFHRLRTSLNRYSHISLSGDTPDSLPLVSIHKQSRVEPPFHRDKASVCVPYSLCPYQTETLFFR